MSQSKTDNTLLRFVLCLHEDEQGESLTIGKVYSVLADPKAESRGLLRVIDDSGEDYLYSSQFFVPVKLPLATGRALLAAMIPTA